MSNILSEYQEIIKSNPLLSREQEIVLAKKIKEGDLNAKNKMIESNYRLVINMAKKYYENNKNLDFRDLIAESQLGLLRAIERFDYEKGFKFSTYACWWIKQALMSFINDSSCLIKTPQNNKVISSKAQKIRKEYLENFGYTPDNSEIADILGISNTTLNNIENNSIKIISIDEELNGQNAKSSSSDLKKTSVGDVIPSNESSQYDKMVNKELRKILIDSLKLLSPREEKILRLRFGLYSSDDDIDNFPITLNELLTLNAREK
jgi:RNA polymerase primary sigma factor